MSSADQHKATIRRMYDETNRGNYDVLYEVLADDFVSHGGAGMPDTHGPQALIDLVGMFMGAMPDLRFEVLQIIADDNMVACRGLQTATHAGNFMGIAPATGNRVEWTGTATFRFNDAGKIAERWVDMDSLSLFQQLGVVPSFGPAAG
jgi:predicted ester cyclase